MKCKYTSSYITFLHVCSTSYIIVKAVEKIVKKIIHEQSLFYKLSYHYEEIGLIRPTVLRPKPTNLAVGKALFPCSTWHGDVRLYIIEMCIACAFVASSSVWVASRLPLLLYQTLISHSEVAQQTKM